MKNKELAKKLKLLIFIFLVHFAINRLSGYFVSQIVDIDELFPVSIDENDIVNDIFFIFLFFGILIPTIEEISFRLWINRSFKFVLTSTVILLAYSLITSSNYVIISLTVCFFVGHVLVWKYFGENKIIQNLVLIFHALLFAGIHLENYQVNDLINYYYCIPALILPQFVLGIIAFYLATKYGFKYSLIYHIAYNSILIIEEYLILVNA
ncbi:CPBP family glutamic-type intramembrane protease [Belliella kenyensis]|uniref:CPBP family glutamic-type intramembrane protease n=1 Tax=Belliella kenyensis TaxID=1472724 RepID=A0ABV8EJE1_9BACT|nr:CPBP family glutamic-type intramembrane protease [Belliella kenyensis]MCH7401286.1 CPBP family glutamic-type intramembrane protease [Belliella kenyensis]MDN3602731.1 CPBP family glutamic-type intramembrane protease [Belliella kenyensis]